MPISLLFSQASWDFLHGARAYVSGQQTRAYKCRRQGGNRELLRCADAVCVCDCNELLLVPQVATETTDSRSRTEHESGDMSQDSRDDQGQLVHLRPWAKQSM